MASPRTFGAVLLVVALMFAPRPAASACAPVTPVACPNCFAVFFMPDTQGYVNATFQPKGGNHLDLVTRYICDHRTSWTEPSTGKQMPILMTIHLGDLVQSADGGTANPNEAQWALVDSAFDNLDSCSPNVPYLVTLGNHDIVGHSYENESRFYNSYFGVDRWTDQGYGCPRPDLCDWDAGQYFIGGGDDIAVATRNNVGPGTPGPDLLQPGRHRAARIRTPNGQPFVFLGLELAFDFPRGVPAEDDDTAWPLSILKTYPDAPTIVFHHSMLWAFDPPDTRLRWGPETWNSDSITPPAGSPNDPDFGLTGGMEALYERLIEPFPQAAFLFTGHVFRPVWQADYTIPRHGKPPVHAFMRNYQIRSLPADRDFWYGVGWNVIAVFDPDAQQVRVRSYRIDDVEAYSDPPSNLDHAGQAAPTECFDMDDVGVGERVISWDFMLGENPAPAVSPAGPGDLAVGLQRLRMRR
jgi:hypothetical protein